MTVAGTYLYQKWDRRTSPPVLIMWPSTGNLGWGFQQSNPVDSLESCCDPENNRLINTLKFYLLTAPCFRLARLFDWSRWVAISSVPLKWSPSSRTCNVINVVKKAIGQENVPRSLMRRLSASAIYTCKFGHIWCFCHYWWGHWRIQEDVFQN